MRTSDKRVFWMKVDEEGLKFHSSRNSAGNLIDNPIIKTADGVFEWVRSAEGARKRFGTRKGVQPKKV